MIRTSLHRIGWAGVAARLGALAVIVAAGGCDSSAPAVPAAAQATLQELPPPTGSLPDVTVTLKPSTRTRAETTGYAWYITSIKDPARGSYTAAVERRSLTRLWFDVADDGAQRASIALLLHDGRAVDLVLSTEHGRFSCSSPGRDNSCALRVSTDDGAARPVRFVAMRHGPATSLHLAGGDDARRLLAAIGKARRLRIQASFEDEGSPEIEFALNGLNPAIARLMKRSVAVMAKASVADPGA
jgi:hypothetical protein